MLPGEQTARQGRWKRMGAARGVSAQGVFLIPKTMNSSHAGGEGEHENRYRHTEDTVSSVSFREKQEAKSSTKTKDKEVWQV